MQGERLEKYLEDGRKVVVLNEINDSQSVVKEIYVDEAGNEFPSGDSFVARNLHDKPVVSYKEKQLLKIQDDLKRVERDIENSRMEFHKIAEKLKAHRAVLRSTDKLISHLPEEDLSIFTAFVTGTIEYLVVGGYDITPPVKMMDFLTVYEKGYFDYIKLASVMGKSEGSLSYRIHEYYDHSGGSVEVFPFRNEYDALKHIATRAIKLISENRLSEASYDACMKMGVSFSTELTEEYEKANKERRDKKIAIMEKEIADRQAKLDRYISGVTDSKKGIKP